MNDLISANALFVKGEYEKAAELYRSLAYSGDLDAMFNMGYLHQFGIGVELDLEKAADFYAVAIYLDGGDAAYNLAVMTMNGLGVKQDIAKGIHYMELSANGGCPEAQLYLATAYSIGYAGNPSYSNICRIPFHRAERRYDFSSLSGYIDEAEQDRLDEARYRAITESQIEAHRRLSMLSVMQDENDVYTETLRDAKYLLGLYTIEGIGCQINRKKGQRLIREAALAGSEEAKQFLLSPENK
ncbi:MAG: tetratricopeptide repeat protein [Clostridia bacterium]|nr:tetratricopeptide repeat protein [Clostridia bacterium]